MRHAYWKEHMRIHNVQTRCTCLLAKAISQKTKILTPDVPQTLWYATHACFLQRLICVSSCALIQQAMLHDLNVIPAYYGWA
jgi:hypothetical protein